MASIPPLVAKKCDLKRTFCWRLEHRNLKNEENVVSGASKEAIKFKRFVPQQRKPRSLGFATHDAGDDGTMQWMESDLSGYMCSHRCRRPTITSCDGNMTSGEQTFNVNHHTVNVIKRHESLLFIKDTIQESHCDSIVSRFYCFGDVVICINETHMNLPKLFLWQIFTWGCTTTNMHADMQHVYGGLWGLRTFRTAQTFEGKTGFPFENANQWMKTP